jgi:hypothetical protein
MQSAVRQGSKFLEPGLGEVKIRCAWTAATSVFNRDSNQFALV